MSKYQKEQQVPASVRNIVAGIARHLKYRFPIWKKNSLRWKALQNIHEDWRSVLDLRWREQLRPTETKRDFYRYLAGQDGFWGHAGIAATTLMLVLAAGFISPLSVPGWPTIEGILSMLLATAAMIVAVVAIALPLLTKTGLAGEERSRFSVGDGGWIPKLCALGGGMVGVLLAPALGRVCTTWIGEVSLSAHSVAAAALAVLVVVFADFIYELAQMVRVVLMSHDAEADVKFHMSLVKGLAGVIAMHEATAVALKKSTDVSLSAFPGQVMGFTEKAPVTRIATPARGTVIDLDVRWYADVQRLMNEAGKLGQKLKAEAFQYPLQQGGETTVLAIYPTPPEYDVVHLERLFQKASKMSKARPAVNPFMQVARRIGGAVARQDRAEILNQSRLHRLLWTKVLDTADGLADFDVGNDGTFKTALWLQLDSREFHRACNQAIKWDYTIVLEMARNIKSVALEALRTNQPVVMQNMFGLLFAIYYWTTDTCPETVATDLSKSISSGLEAATWQVWAQPLEGAADQDDEHSALQWALLRSGLRLLNNAVERRRFDDASEYLQQFWRVPWSSGGMYPNRQEALSTQEVRRLRWLTEMTALVAGRTIDVARMRVTRLGERERLDGYGALLTTCAEHVEHADRALEALFALDDDGPSDKEYSKWDTLLWDDPDEQPTAVSFRASGPDEWPVVGAMVLAMRAKRKASLRFLPGAKPFVDEHRVKRLLAILDRLDPSSTPMEVAGLSGTTGEERKVQLCETLQSLLSGAMAEREESVQSGPLAPERRAKMTEAVQRRFEDDEFLGGFGTVAPDDDSSQLSITGALRLRRLVDRAALISQWPYSYEGLWEPMGAEVALRETLSLVCGVRERAALEFVQCASDGEFAAAIEEGIGKVQDQRSLLVLPGRYYWILVRDGLRSGGIDLTADDDHRIHPNLAMKKVGQVGECVLFSCEAVPLDYAIIWRADRTRRALPKGTEQVLRITPVDTPQLEKDLAVKDCTDGLVRQMPQVGLDIQAASWVQVGEEPIGTVVLPDLTRMGFAFDEAECLVHRATCDRSPAEPTRRSLTLNGIYGQIGRDIEINHCKHCEPHRWRK